MIQFTNATNVEQFIVLHVCHQTDVVIQNVIRHGQGGVFHTVLQKLAISNKNSNIFLIQIVRIDGRHIR